MTLFHDLYNGYALFRKRVHLATLPKTALAWVTADQSYHLYVNGRFVCRGPARGYQESWPIDNVDLAPYLIPGDNVIAIRAYNPGCSSFQYRFADCAGLLFVADLGGMILTSDHSWLSRRQAGVKRDTEPSSLQLFPQEHIDYRIEPSGWMELDFDDQVWRPADISRMWNSPPWLQVEERGIPLLKEERVELPLPTAVQHGICHINWNQARDVLALRAGEGFEFHRGTMLPEAAGDWLIAPPLPAENFVSYLFDLGTTQVGSLAVEIRNAQGGETLDFIYMETVDPQTLVPHLADQEVRLGSRLICGPGTSAHLFFHPYAFRHFVLTLRGASHPLRIKLSLKTIRYPLHVQGRFTTSDPALDRIWSSCAWTQQICSLDAYVDTPWREQAQWWGDARVQAWNTFHLSTDARLLRRGIRIMAGQMTKNGLIYGHAPTKAHHCILPDFSLIWILTIWDYWWQTGDATLLSEYEEPIHAILTYFREQTHPQHGLIAHDPRYWLFLDWSPELLKEGYPSVLTLWLILALDKIEELAVASRTQDRWGQLRPWRDELAKGIESLIDQQGLVRDGRMPNGDIATGASVHAQTLCIEAGICPAYHSAMLAHGPLRFVRGLTPHKQWPSIYWMVYVFRSLIRRGHGSEVVRFIRGPWMFDTREHPAPSTESAWEQMARHGTTWSQFNHYGGRQSHSHAWSAHPLFHLMETLGGIIQTSAAWRTVDYRPLFCEEWADVTVPTPHGPIRSQWRRVTGERYQVSLNLPKGVSARVRLPGEKESICTGNQRWEIDLAEHFPGEPAIDRRPELCPIISTVAR